MAHLWATGRGLGLELGDGLEVRQGPETVRQLQAADHTADGTTVLQRIRDGTLVEAIVSEIQRERDEDKWWTWPLHVAGVRARLRCPVTLVVLTPHRNTARWANHPIDIGRGRMKLHPLVIGPDQVPRELELAEARKHPALATLAVMMHGRRTGSKRLAQVALRAVLERLDQGQERSTLLLTLITASLHAKTLREIEEEMEIGTDVCFTKIGRRKFAEGHEQGLERGLEQGLERGLEQGLERGLEQGLERGLEQGRQEARRQAIALVLESRGLAITSTQRHRLERCTDDTRLELWLRRAATVEQVRLLFARAH